MPKITRRIPSIFFLLLIFTLSKPMYIQFAEANPSIINVPTDYIRIQDAINAAQEGDIINVSPGVYYEHLVVNKSITLLGGTGVILDGNGTGTILHITSGNVAVSGFTVTNGYRGIAVDRSDNITLTNNVVSYNEIGIVLLYSSNVTLTSNSLSNNTYNFGVWGSALSHFINKIDMTNTIDGKPIYYYINKKNILIDPAAYKDIGYLGFVNSSNIIVKDLTLTRNYQGILLAYTTNAAIEDVNASNNMVGIHLSFSKSNVISNCVIYKNDYGVYMIHSDNNTLAGNTVLLNNGPGIKLWDSNDNMIHHNNLINNYVQVYSHRSSNRWDNGAGEGNYWSDYKGEDIDEDGVGDTLLPHHGVDYYPLMQPWGKLQDNEPPIADAGPDIYIIQGMTVTFDAGGSSDNIGIASYIWTFTDVTQITLVGVAPTYTFNNTGDFKVTLKVTDYAGNTATDEVWVHVSADTVPPTADAGPDQIVEEDTVVTFDASASTDNVRITNYTWMFIDSGEEKVLCGVKVKYIFETPGNYTITLNVTDPAGNWAIDTLQVMVRDVTSPIAEAGSDRTVTVGEEVTFDAGESTDNVAIINYTWDFGDGTKGEGVTVKHVYQKPGTYTVTLTVTDAAGNTATDTIIVTVKEEFPWWIVTITAAVIVGIIALIAIYVLRLKRRS